MINDEEIKRFNDILLLVRHIIGWSAEDFGERIGVTRQTINNLENGRGKLNKTQYIAMRSVIETEMEEHPDETEMLKVLLDSHVDHPENYTEEAKKEIYQKAAMLAPAITSDTTKRKEISKEWKKILIALGILTAPTITALIVGAWRTKK